MGGLSGQVLTQDSAGIPGVSIFIKNTSIGTATNSDGSFTLGPLKPGQYVLQVQALGYAPQVKTIKLGDNEQQVQNFRLKESSLELEEVNVESKSRAEELRETSFNVDVRSTKNLQNFSTDINQVLKTTPGIHIREAGGLGSGFNLSLNGLSGNQIRYFIDGVPMENFGSALSLNNFPVNLIEQVEVYKGVVPISLGADALGGAINITTAARQKTYLDASYSFGSFNTHRAAVNGQYANRNKGYFLRLSSFFNHSDNNYRMHQVPLYDLELGNDLGEINLNRFHSAYRSGMARLEAGLFNKKYADLLTVSFTQSGNYKEYQHPDNNIKRVFGGFHTRNKTQLLSANYRKQFGDLKLRGYLLSGRIQESVIDTSSKKYNWAGEYIQRAADDPKGELYERRSLLELTDRVVKSNLMGDYQLHKNHRISLSYNQNYLHRSGQDRVNEFNTSFEAPSALHKNIFGLSYTFTSPSGRWEAIAFAKEYLYAGEIVSNNQQDERVEHSLSFNNQGFGAAASYWLNEKLQLKSSFEQAYRLPEAFEILGDGIYVNPNPELLPEKSYNANLGSRYQTRAGKLSFSTEANYFLRASQNFIRFKPLGPFGQYENLSNVLTNGVEAGIHLEYGEWISLDLNGTYQSLTDQTKEDEGLPNVNYRSQVPNIPYFFSNARLGLSPWPKLSHGNLRLFWSSRYVHNFFLTWANLGHADSKHIIPAQLTHDLEIEYAMQDGRYNLSLSFTNLTDAIVYDNFRIQKPGRAVYVKLRYAIF